VLGIWKYTIELAINFAAKRASHVSNVNGQASREGGGMQGSTARVRPDTGIQTYLVASSLVRRESKIFRGVEIGIDRATKI
jgi:hypothetical protein